MPALTPALLRLDLKCGRGAISEGEKCHKGPASRVQPARKHGISGVRVAQGVVVGLAVGVTAAHITAARNHRNAFAEKFGDASKYKPFAEEYGNPSQVRQQFVRDKSVTEKAGSFGSVQFGTYNGRKVVVKTAKPSENGDLEDILIKAKVDAGEMSQRTADAIKAASGKITEGEVFAARKASELGFGPKVYAASSDTLVLDVAQGRELSRTHLLLRKYEDPSRLQSDLANRPQNVVATSLRSSRKYSQLSDTNKTRILDSLAKMHSAGIAHNDLHMKNVFVSARGAQFIDFGLSETGGAAVSSEFVRLMNPPRYGLNHVSGFGYNLKTLDPEGYAATEKRIKQIIGKKVGALTSNDIRAAVAKANNSASMEAQLQEAVDAFYSRYVSRSRSDSFSDMPALTPALLRTDAPGRRCGQGYIAANKKCQAAGGGAFPTRKAIAAGLGVAAGAGLTAYALRRSASRRQVVPVRVTTMASKQISPGAPVPALPGDRTTRLLRAERGTRQLRGSTPYGLLPPSPPRLGRTGRMRANTGAAIRRAERRIAQTARAEVNRIAQIGNTMAAAGEATGMAAKTTFRELRLRAEAARRRWEPGYRRPDTPRPPRMLQGGDPEPVRFPFRPRVAPPQRIRIRRRDAADDKKYSKTVVNPETGRKKKVRYGAKGYSIAPGTSKGDRYCARSFGDMQSHGKDCSGADRNTPLCLSRTKWRCSGKTSRRGDTGLTPLALRAFV